MRAKGLGQKPRESPWAKQDGDGSHGSHREWNDARRLGPTAELGRGATGAGGSHGQ